MIEIKVPSITSNEDTVSLIEIKVENNQLCKIGEIICIFESTKTIFELSAENSGYVFFIAKQGSEVKTHQIVAYISESPIEKKKMQDMSNSTKVNNATFVITKKAQAIIDEKKIDANKIKQNGVIKVSDVINYLENHHKIKKDNGIYDDFEKIMKSNNDEDASVEDIINLKQTLLLAQKIYKNKWSRSIPSLDILFDRWSAGENFNFGNETNIYHSSYVFGDVAVGEQTFIGPFTIIDGSGGLEIGNYCSIAAGAHIYSHDTIAKALSGNKEDVKTMPTRIGNSCFIGPNSVITKGVRIGDHCFVGANSVVTFDLEPNTAVSGNPAKIIGKVIIKKDGSVKIEKTSI